MAIIDLVKYSGPNSVFAWKFPSEELSTWTQLIVNESQEAVFFKGGRALDVFGPGRHTLDTDNIPLLTSLIRLPFGGQSPFSAEVWFVNKAHSLDVKWGTPTPIQIQDPKFGIMVPVRSFGQFGIQVENSAKFLAKLVGTTRQFDQETLTRVFRGLFLTKTKDTLAQYLVKKGISILEMSAYLDELSDHIRDRTAPFLAEYGLKLLNFFVNDVSVPEDDPAVIQLKGALARKAEMNIIGYDYTQQRSFDVLEGAAKNPGGAGAAVMGAGIGLGMGAGLGAAFGQQAAGAAAAVSIAPPGQRVRCPACGAETASGTRFCPSCGKPLQQQAQQAQREIRCDKCGTLMSPDARFCPNCGDPYNPCPKCGQDLPKGATSCPSCGYALPTPCPKCGAALDRPGLKFCPSCGFAVGPKKCPKCNTDNAPAAKFCLNCGQKL
ncbi:MAG: SPFH domain-containing protein [Deltaproteobacteria bacterium]|jgi:membrane protease subunit (stomatin/prohibitin family)|nr:SPFH domain-containing protein [Deltaproteobacteria bacterium]